MKKLLIYLAIFGLLAAFVSAASVTRNMASTIEPGKELSVSFNVADMEVGKSVAISDTVPSQFSISSWSVSGANKADVTYEVNGKEYRWDIPAQATSVSLTYTIQVPSSASGSYSFSGIYIAPPAKFDELKATLNVAAAQPEAPPAPAETPPPETPPPAPAEEAPVEEAEGKSNTGVIIGVILVIIIVVAFVLISRKKK